MKQKFQDLLLLIKHDKKWQILTGVLVFVIAYSFVADPKPTRIGMGRSELPIKTGAESAASNVEDTISYFTSQVYKIEQNIAQNQESINKIVEGQKKQETQTAKIFAGIIDRLRSVEEGIDAVNNYKAPTSTAVMPSADVVFGDMDPGELVAPPERPKNDKVAFIGAGDSVRVKLLAGVNAPTDGTPYPVVFKLEGDITGPDGSSLSLGEARLIAAANGSLSDQRALIRLNKMNIRYPDGSRKVLDVDGWIVGEDGIRGMEGVLIDPIGKILTGALAGGLAEGFLARGTNQNQGGGNFEDSFVNYEVGLATGAQRMGNTWQNFIEERSRLLIPHVKVLSGRTATAVFSQNVVIDGLMEIMDEPEAHFVSLD